MKALRTFARVCALFTGAVVASSCDSRLPTQVGSGSAVDDVERPQLSFAVPGAMNNAVILGTPVVVNVTATDNKGVSAISTTIRNGAVVIAVDTATLKPAPLTTLRALTIPVTAIKKGDRIVVRTTVTDAALNLRTDSVVITVAVPTLELLTPLPGAKLNVGDSVLVTVHLRDESGLKSLVLSGYSLRGSAVLGTQDTIIRYPAITAPATGASFAANVRDTTITRYLKATTPVDTLTDSLVVRAVATDALGAVDTARVTIKIVRGPSVTVLSPIPGDSVTPGAGLTITLRAADPTGVARVGFRLQSDASFPTKVDTTILTTLAGLPKDFTFTATVAIPGNATPKGQLTITPISSNVGGQDGASAPSSIAVRAGLPPAPRVFQAIPSRVETTDSITLTALGNGIRIVGYILRDSASTVIKRDSITLTPPFPSTAVVTIPLNLAPSVRGKRITLTSFAYDQGGRIGFSLQPGTLNFQSTAANAFVDSALVTFGTTYPLPVGRNGTVADLQVDAARGNIFLSNINFGRLEVWSKGVNNFDPTGIVVGSQPWGMTFSRTAAAKDTMYVANSGGTNISRVFVGGAPGSMKEDLDHRIVTRASYLFKFTEIVDASTGKIRRTVSAPVIFSDRPQNIEQSSSGRLYFSTKPTLQAPSGTIRYMTPSDSAPDERFILDFAFLGADPTSWVLANLDYVEVFAAPAGSTESDQVVLYDHPSGTKDAPISFTSKQLQAKYITAVPASSALPDTASIQTLVRLFRRAINEIALARNEPQGSDIQIANNIDFGSLGLTDTTYSAASGDGRWITFGEGNKAPVARNFVLQDIAGVSTVPNDTLGRANKYNYASPSLNISDLMSNSSDNIFGVALDKTGLTLGAHGTETAFSRVDIPFTQRLQGKKTTFAQGAGIAFHPNANGTSTPAASRLAFVASNNGSLEAVDIAFYDFVRGSLATKYNLYGPLRASLPFPGDPANVVFKLFGLSSKGLLVVDVTATDILPGP